MTDITAFSNALTAGEVSFVNTLNVRPVQDRNGGIVQLHGERAVVYPMATADRTSLIALRVPLDHQSGRDWQSRYSAMSGNSGAMSSHMPQHIVVHRDVGVADVDIALVYDWVSGETLTSRVGHAGDRIQRDSLSDLLVPLAALAEAMRTSGMLHGDIAPGNIIVRPDGGVGLVDFDGATVRGSDIPAVPRRRPGYRLPRGGGSPGEEDAFGLLVLMASCAIIADSNVPINRGDSVGESHPAILFTSWDLMDPRRSRIVREVSGQLSRLSSSLLELLESACTGSSDRAPSLLLDAVREIRVSGLASDETASDGRDQHAAWDQIPGEWQVDEHQHTTESSSEPVAVQSRSWPNQESLQSPSTAGWDRSSYRSIEDVVEDINMAIQAAHALPGASRRAERAERRRQEVAGELHEALAQRDRDKLVRLAMSGALAELGDSDRDDVLQVLRALAHDTITRAIGGDDDRMILDAVDESVFARDEDIDEEFRDRVVLARDRLTWSDHVDEAVIAGDANRSAELLSRAPRGGVRRLSAPIRSQAERLAEESSAIAGVQRALDDGEPSGLAAALGRLSGVCALWTDHVDMGAVIELLGTTQIEERFIARLNGGGLRPSDQWMADVVIASGRLPEATRKSGMSSRDIDRMLFSAVGGDSD